MKPALRIVRADKALNKRKQTMKKQLLSLMFSAVLAIAPASGAIAGAPTVDDMQVQLDDATVAQPADFSGQDLSRLDLSGMDLSGVNLAGADLSDARLENTRLQGANLVGAWLDGAVLIGADLTGANLTDASLIGANLAEAEGLDSVIGRRIENMG